MSNIGNKLFTELEIDALREIMNISFGNAAADLSDIIDIYIKLNVPDIKIIEIPKLPEYIRNEITDFKNCSIVEQEYHGDFSGLAFLIFPYGVERELISFFQNSNSRNFESDELIELEREVLMEIGNILIGACIGKLIELIESKVSYLPPHTIIGDKFQDLFLQGHFTECDVAITMKTNFSFQDRNVSGYLFLINSQKSIPHLKKALLKFLGQ
jgi:chemotaxis protein CheC